MPEHKESGANTTRNHFQCPSTLILCKFSKFESNTNGYKLESKPTYPDTVQILDCPVYKSFCFNFEIGVRLLDQVYFFS